MSGVREEGDARANTRPRIDEPSTRTMSIPHTKRVCQIIKVPPLCSWLLYTL